MKKYGIDFPSDCNDLTVELHCYNTVRYGSPTPQMLTAAQHMEMAIKQIYDEKTFSWHPWTYVRLNSFCTDTWATWIGCGASGKSTDAAMFCYMHFLAGMDKTTIRLYSTTREMLKLRIWADLVKFHLIFPSGLRYIPSETKIVYGNKQDTINGIFGQGVLRDNGEKAVANLVGVHNDRNLTGLDEMQGTPDDLVKGAANTITSGKFQFVGMGNITGPGDTLGTYGEPWNGWSSVDENSTEWVSRVGRKFKGKCYRFDGEHSPRITEHDGEKKFPFLIGREAIDSIKDIFGEDSIEYWSQARGYPKTGMSIDTFLDYETVERFRMKEQAVFMFGYKVVAGFDPAFTSGGDKPMLSFAKVGLTPQGVQVVSFFKTVHIQINVSQGSNVTDHLCRKVMEECSKQGVKPFYFAMDCTGQETLADVLTEKWGRGIKRIHFGKKASEKRVSAADKRVGKDAFVNRVSEIWHNISMFSRSGQLKGLDDQAVVELTSRKSLIDPRNFKRAAESKSKMRSRSGHSPDNADSKALALLVAKEVIGLLPGRPAKNLVHNKMRGYVPDKPAKRAKFRSRKQLSIR